MKICTRICAFYMSSLLLFCLACSERKEVAPASAPVTVAEAQAWFSQHHAGAPARSGKSLPERTPRWEEARLITLTGNVPAVSIPLQYRTGGPGRGGLARLLFFREQGRAQVRVMKLISDSLSYYRNRERIELNNFSGVLTMHDWQENFLYGVQYTDGAVTGTLSLPSRSGRRGLTCETVTITHYVKVCIGTECETSVDYVEEYIECKGGSGDGPLPRGPIGGGGGGSSPSQPREPFTFARLQPRLISIPGLEQGPIDLSRYLACFGTITDNAVYQITVYVDEPAPGFGLNKVGVDVGHTFVGLRKQYPGTDSYVQQVFGFYPNGSAADILSGTVPSEFSSNGSSGYTVSVTYTVGASQFRSALNAASALIGQPYNLATHNCTDAVFSITDAAGLPHCTDAVFSITDAAGLPLPKSNTMLPWGGRVWSFTRPAGV